MLYPQLVWHPSNREWKSQLCRPSNRSTPELKMQIMILWATIARIITVTLQQIAQFQITPSKKPRPAIYAPDTYLSYYQSWHVSLVRKVTSYWAVWVYYEQNQVWRWSQHYSAGESWSKISVCSACAFTGSFSSQQATFKSIPVSSVGNWVQILMKISKLVRH